MSEWTTHLDRVLTPSRTRTFSGQTHDGTPVVVTVHDAEGVADLAFADATGRFGPAVELSEEI